MLNSPQNPQGESLTNSADFTTDARRRTIRVVSAPADALHIPALAEPDLSPNMPRSFTAGIDRL